MKLSDIVDLIDKPFEPFGESGPEITVIGHEYDNDQHLVLYVKRDHGDTKLQARYATIPNFEQMYFEAKQSGKQAGSGRQR